MSNLGTQYPIKKYLVIATVLIAVLIIIGASMSVSAKEQSNPFLYAFSPDGTVTKIDLKTHQVVGQPKDMGVTLTSQWSNHYWDGKTMWTSIGGGVADAVSEVVGVDVRTQRITHRIDITPISLGPIQPNWPGWGITNSQYTQITPNQELVYHVNSKNDEIIEIDPETDTITARILIPDTPGGTDWTPNGSVFPCDNSISPDGKLLVVPNLLDPYFGDPGSVSFFDIDKKSPTYLTEIKRINVTGFIIMSTVSPDGRYTSVELGATGEYILDMSTMEVDTVVAGAFGSCSEYTKDGQFMYLTGGRNLTVIRMSDLTIEKIVDVGHGVGCVMTWSTDGQYAYYPNNPGRSITIIDTATHEVVGSIPIDHRPGTLVVLPPMRHDGVELGD